MDGLILTTIQAWDKYFIIISSLKIIDGGLNNQFNSLPLVDSKVMNNVLDYN